MCGNPDLGIVSTNLIQQFRRLNYNGFVMCTVVCKMD